MPLRMLMLWLLALSFSVAWIVWPHQVGKKEGALAHVARIQGNVSIRPAGSFGWTSARKGSHLQALDAIATGTNSRAELLLVNGATIVLPADTQIKLQAQTVIPGMTISLIKGGLEVQAEGGQPASSKKPVTPKPGIRLAAAKPITIQTNRYSVDLSRLEGQFKLQAGAGAQASRPETVRVQNAKGAISLAKLEDSARPKLDEQLDESFADTPIPAVIEVSPEPPVEAPRIKTIEAVKVPESETVPESMDETPAPETLPLVDEPEEELVPPRLKDTQLDFWAVDSIEETLEIPLVLPLAGPKPDFNPERWQTILRISLRGTKQTIIVKREPGSLGMFFYLRELQSLLPQKDLEGLQLVIESGLMRRGDNEDDVRMADLKTAVTLHSLQNRQAMTLLMDGWRYVEPTDQWIRTPFLSRADVTLHLLEPLMLAELEGYVRGARAFTVQPLHAASRLTAIHFVRGQSIVATTDVTDERVIKGLIRRLEPDLVYQGSHQAFLGGKGSFDLNKETQRAGDLYYVRNTRVLKLDRNLFKTHSAARAFIRNFDPYFMSMPVEILYNRN
ncbi:FecR domain-containing protein [Oligoflexus tunisiensis]|uniref:FecR domain-containing protein n=1 Tax=Oligoflexus tunisiensis TaxID=708132 RepID=UPI00114D029A|nr:FecR domain-containing protein [Oligoflexus tunisiensis]